MTDIELLRIVRNAIDLGGVSLYRAAEAIDARLAQPEPEKSLSQRMREAGFTPRDIRLECDGCGKKFSRLMLPIHDCEVAQPEPEELGEIIPADEEQLKRIAKLVEPEPVAYHNDYLEQVARTACRAFHRLDESPFGAGRVLRDIALDMIEYAKKQTAPPRKQWQGLTDEEIMKITGVTSADSDWNVVIVHKWIRAIEQALKEKNHG